MQNTHKLRDSYVPKSQKIVLDRLTSPTTDYLLECIVGEGTYGQVVKCVKTATKEMVAVKIFKKEDDHWRHHPASYHTHTHTHTHTPVIMYYVCTQPHVIL
uniref:Protein kinase domain-containing protein n=1 Tax=Cynoglossus semilaevis TaxID=244447 RepID=A0A3P8W4X8_CYNSE